MLVSYFRAVRTVAKKKVSLCFMDSPFALRNPSQTSKPHIFCAWKLISSILFLFSRCISERTLTRCYSVRTVRDSLERHSENK
jgi:hypothetical protein